MRFCKVLYGAKRNRSTEPFPTSMRSCMEALYVVRKHRLRDIETRYIYRLYMHEGAVNSSFRAKDGLQQLQTVVDSSSYKSTSICEDLRSMAH